MHLARQLQELLSAYVEGRLAVESVRDWLEDHVQAIADAHDAEAQRLSFHAWGLISELDYGHRTDADLRRTLGDLLSTLPAIAWVDWAWAEQPSGVTESAANNEPVVLSSFPAVITEPGAWVRWRVGKRLEGVYV